MSDLSENPQHTGQSFEIFHDRFEKEAIGPAYLRAKKLLEAESISPEQFPDYSTESLAKCDEYVTQKKLEFQRRREQDPSWARAEIFGKTLEGIFHDMVNRGIYGEDVRGVSTAPYDDYHAGIDEIIERYNPDGSTLIGCAIDLTFGNPEHKMNLIHEQIKQGYSNNVFFYESPFGDPPHIHGKLQGLPKVVVGMDAPHLVKLAQQWNTHDDESLHHNHLFLSILNQIRLQSDTYSTLARRLGQMEISRRYEQVCTAVSKLLTEQKAARNVVTLDQQVSSDLVNRSIQAHLEHLLRSY